MRWYFEPGDGRFRLIGYSSGWTSLEDRVGSVQAGEWGSLVVDANPCMSNGSNDWGMVLIQTPGTKRLAIVFRTDLWGRKLKKRE